MSSLSSLLLLLRVALLIHLSGAWTTTTTTTSNIIRRPSTMIPTRSKKTQLQSGIGIAKDYTWREEAFEIEVTVQVPPETKAKDVGFKARANSIELTLTKKVDGGDDDNKNETTTEKVILLDPTRALRGRIVIDGTYWVISDSIEDEVKNSAAAETDDDDDDDKESSAKQPGRQVTVTIEKQIQKAKDDFDVVDYDWNGVYREEEKDEVSYRKYDEPEEMDVREYAQSLGVDIDNINMSMVDKSMFSSGLNTTSAKSNMESMMDAGLMKEVTQQGDGSEWTMGKDGERVPFNSMLKDKDKDDSLYSAEDEEGGRENDAIPFLDTDSPWHDAPDATAAEEAAKDDKKKNKALEEKKKQLEKKRQKEAIDPISTLTVARLREILRSRGLKVSGNKKELQDRLRAEVQSLVKMDTTE
ncbi:unnamed protein product [Cylindrotheca closterium]|uniref:SAP domain-containing protein n=1 Tax=Cylindrotheca closterium TaxID=2856 RepID=A0AAD2CF99_9STRA|nr:unnamed protein product [Cylindrotheca closterium]